MKDYFETIRSRGYNICYVNSKDVEANEIKCGYCGSVIAPHIGYAIRQGDQVGSIIAYIYKCPHCKNPLIYFVREKTAIPGSMYGRGIKNLPEKINLLYSECRTCYANQCYTASQMIARTILMHIAVEQGADENGTFAYYVDYLDSQGYIPPNGKAWVDFIRTSGNIANHELIIKEKEETEKVISFLSTLLLVIYELPNEL